MILIGRCWFSRSDLFAVRVILIAFLMMFKGLISRNIYLLLFDLIFAAIVCKYSCRFGCY